MSILPKKEVTKYYTKYKFLGTSSMKINVDGIMRDVKKNAYVQSYNGAMAANMISAAHKSIFSKYKNINLGKDVVIVATGPTLAKFKPIENAVYIGVNRAYQYDKVKLDYIFMQSYHAVKPYIKDIYTLDIPKFFGEIVLDNRPMSDLIIPEFEYLNAKAEKYYYTYYKNLTLFPVNIEQAALASVLTVAHSALHFALWTHPKRIYLVGCDTTSAPYWDGGEREEQYVEVADFVNNTAIDGYKKFKYFADTHYPDVEIISVNPVGLKGIFTDIYTEDEN